MKWTMNDNNEIVAYRLMSSTDAKTAIFNTKDNGKMNWNFFFLDSFSTVCPIKKLHFFVNKWINELQNNSQQYGSLFLHLTHTLSYL